jgi:hypothetical protein
VKLNDVRTTLATVLAPTDNEYQLYKDLVDAIDVPCVMLLWDEPWFESTGVCTGIVHPVVMPVAGRVEPGETLNVLEAMVADVIARLRDDSNGWGIVRISGPRVFDIAALGYIATRIGLRAAVTF